MNSFHNAKWSWPITVIPLWLFLWIHYGTYQIIQEELSAEEFSRWLLYGTLLILLWVFHTGFTIIKILTRDPLEKKYGYITLFLYLSFVLVYLGSFYSMIPPSIPGWVASENKRIYALIFIAPTLVHSLIIINVSEATSKETTIRKLFIIGGSILGCILLLTMLPNAEPGIEHYFVILMFLFSSVVFLNGIIKVLDVNRLKVFFIKDKYVAMAKPLLAVSFPLTGMFLNNDILFDAGFGNFSNVSFYMWSILNGLAICAPDFKQKTYRIVIFLLRSMTYSYIIWLMTTFMPHLALSAIAINSFGLGYLMITPLVIIIFHTKLLVDDAGYLYYHLPRRTIRTMFVSAVSLPIIINTFEMLTAQP